MTGEFSRVRGPVKYGRGSAAEPSIRGFEGKEESRGAVRSLQWGGREAR